MITYRLIVVVAMACCCLTACEADPPVPAEPVRPTPLPRPEPAALPQAPPDSDIVTLPSVERECRGNVTGVKAMTLEELTKCGQHIKYLQQDSERLAPVILMSVQDDTNS